LADIQTHDEVTQKVLRAFVTSIVIKWIPKANTHIFWIEFNLGLQQSLKFESALKLTSKRNGWRYSPKDVVYRFRKITPKVSYIKGKKGQPNTIILHENQDIFNIRLYDQKFNEKSLFDK
jgi:hypothetical protein